ncbi:MAG: crotonase/enoyl-CoA hydratase family protein [Caulobacteraceae bacterium]|nr:crotonase/enoyl-CoA hydratase family protein [Caulobacteraceae bacterium]
MADNFLRFERRGALGLITLNRPDKLNALPEIQDGEAFRDLCERINDDRDIRCAVITGAGRAFSAGGDVKAMQARSELFEGGGMAIRERYRKIVHRIVRSVWELQVPLVAAVNGPAVGLGCDLVALADIRIASERARFGVPFLRLGIIPGDGGSWLLPRTIGYARAAELLFTGDLIDAGTAAAWGLVNRVVDHDALMDEALATASRIAAQPPQALRLAKSLLRQGRESSYEAILEMSASAQALAHLTDDHLEGVSAHLEKRTPDFKGR